MPFEPPKECEDAQTFLSRMEEMDKVVARKLNEAHEKRARAENAKRPEPKLFPKDSGFVIVAPRGLGIN